MISDAKASQNPAPASDAKEVETLTPKFAGVEAALALIVACDAHLRDDKVVTIRLGFTVTPEVEIEISNRQAHP